MSRPDEQLSQQTRDLRLKIAIDGPAGAGKSTVGRCLAEALQCRYLDTGLMYRAVTLRALEQHVPLSNGEALSELAASMSFALEGDGLGSLLIDDQPASPLLHSPAVDAAVSEVSAHSEVRHIMVDRQRGLVGDGCIVMVGRDIGATVLPEAPVKLWLTASPEERARRRHDERSGENSVGPSGETLGQIVARDQYDAGRAVSPLRRAADAVVIETERLSPETVVEKSLEAVRSTVERRLTSR